ncbi:Ppx/GppA phosphatase family protein [Glaciibacter psychrotolerans]|uniref:Exopolyphosphatase/guanosine-5'-triphosphate, 3'-diphosphate pyrophosphatase n=1 Tax=Glaciibacter psychrotolerans TaxID=670054 RepID=A0A7Z0EEL3_9MICO|nr:Ppx/GppA phosphatase family protein [Leifsonia psychrotolerans]NYJ19810.1 exopolyphosphatase/guanosine-5'-triphosphate,3'-diphosphate pyrophosphatase [Leifsonia psychrotolerans]
MARVAAIDCGTNTIRLLIADIAGRERHEGHDGHGGQGGLRDVVRTLEVVRLGEGVDRTGRFADAALERTLAVTRRYAEICREHEVERIRFVATSATRDAANRADFTDAVLDILGVPAEVIPGTEEAALSFRGALTALPHPDAAARHLIVDLGGGSTELVLGGSAPDAAYSMDIGCVRLTERSVHSDPPIETELAGIRRDVTAALDVAAGIVDLSQTTDVIGVAGTITTITAHALGLTRYDPQTINGSRLPLHTVLAACESLAGLPRAERAALPYMHPGRVDVIAAGATIWSTILRRVAEATSAVGRPLEFVTTSEHDILDGVALSLVP